MDWMKARDALIAQTMAFVEEVAGRKPETKARVDIVPVDTIESILQDTVRHVEPAVQLEAPRTNGSDSRAASETREEIRKRIENFRAHQHRFHREREEYFNSVLAKARASYGSEIPKA